MKFKKLEGRGNEYLKIPIGSDVIWVDRFKKGYGRKQESLRTTNPAEAREKRDELFAVWLGEKKFISKKVKQLNSDLWPEWVRTKGRKRAKTLESINLAGQHLLSLMGDLYPDQITDSWWETVYIPMKRAERPERKFFNEWKWLSSYLKFSHRQGAIQILPKLENPDPPTEAGLSLEDSEINALYEFGNEELSLQIDFGFRHFMRRSEVLLLPWSEVSFAKGGVDLPAARTKTKKPRFVPLNDALLTNLQARKRASDSPYVFPSPADSKRPIGRTGNQRAWKNAIARANKESQRINPKATFHDLRHSGLSRAFVATNKYAEICIMAGLSLAEAQRTYLHIKPDQLRFVADLVKAGG